MLLDRYGERDYVKVLDFGIARSLHRTGVGLPHGHGRDHRHAGVHVARAVRGQAGRRAQRSLRARPHHLRALRRRAAVSAHAEHPRRCCSRTSRRRRPTSQRARPRCRPPSPASSCRCSPRIRRRGPPTPTPSSRRWKRCRAATRGTAPAPAVGGATAPTAAALTPATVAPAAAAGGAADAGWSSGWCSRSRWPAVWSALASPRASARRAAAARRRPTSRPSRPRAIRRWRASSPTPVAPASPTPTRCRA